MTSLLLSLGWKTSITEYAKRCSDQIKRARPEVPSLARREASKQTRTHEKRHTKKEAQSSSMREVAGCCCYIRAHEELRKNFIFRFRVCAVYPFPGLWREIAAINVEGGKKTQTPLFKKKKKKAISSFESLIWDKIAPIFSPDFNTVFKNRLIFFPPLLLCINDAGSRKTSIATLYFIMFYVQRNVWALLQISGAAVWGCGEKKYLALPTVGRGDGLWGDLGRRAGNKVWSGPAVTSVLNCFSSSPQSCK